MGSLFAELSHLAYSNGQPENQLSRALAASFNSSSVLRRALLELLSSLHSKPLRTPPEEWHCRTEIITSQGDGRLDLVLLPRSRNAIPARGDYFILENKLGAPLTELQLRKYAKGYRRLTVLTRDHPTVPAIWLRRHRIAAVRWHRLHAAFLSCFQGSGEARWVLRSFTSLLEEWGMASRGLTRADMSGIQRTFSLIAGESGDHGVHHLAFGRAAVARNFIEDVAYVARDSVAEKADTVLWGPGYYKEDYEDGTGVIHQLGFDLKQRRKAKGKPSRWIEYYFAFPQNPKASPSAWAAVFSDAKDEALDERVWPESQLFDKNGCFREEQHVRDVARLMRSWSRYLR